VVKLVDILVDTIETGHLAESNSRYFYSVKPILSLNSYTFKKLEYLHQ